MKIWTLRKLFIPYSLQWVRKNFLGIVLINLFIIFLLLMLGNRIFISIEAGSAGVLYKRFKGGTVTDQVYPEGFHIIFPWNKMVIYNVRIETKLHKVDVLSKRGLRIHLTVGIRYHPEYRFLGMLHKNIGPKYLDIIVLPEVESSLRKIIGKYEAEQFYSDKKAITERIIELAREQIAQKFVELDDLVIRRIELTPSIQKAIESKLLQKHLSQEYEFRLERESREKKRLEIEGEGLKKYHELLSDALTEKILRWEGIRATLELARSNNAKMVFIGGGNLGLSLIVGNQKDFSDSTNDTQLQRPKTSNEPL